MWFEGFVALRYLRGKRRNRFINLITIISIAGVAGRVHGEHGWDASDPEGRNPRHLRIRRFCSPATRRYVVVSRDIERWLRESVGVAADRITQIYNGVDTERFFRAAGVVPGMRVLDIGSGMGDVALLAADIVGPGGKVTVSKMTSAEPEVVVKYPVADAK